MKHINKEQLKKTFRTEGLTCILLGAALAFMLCVFAPLDLFINNSGEFWFGINDLLKVSMVVFVLLFVLIIIYFGVVYFINQKFYRGSILIVLCIFICLYIQGSFLVYNLPTLDGASVAWEDYKLDMLISTLLFLIALGILLFLLLKKGFNFIKRVVNAVSIIVLSILSITMVTELIMYKSGDLNNEEIWVTTDYGMFDMSSDRNFVILLLDDISGKKIDEYITENAKWEKTLEDFTFYKDTCGMYAHTYQAIPHILTGVRYEYQDSMENYNTNSMMESPLFKHLKTKQYEMNLYEPYTIIPCDYSAVSDFDNIKNENYNIADYKCFVKEWYELIGFRYSAYPLKRFFNPGTARFAESKGISKYGVFSDRNLDFYKACNDNEICTTDKRQFKFIHLEGGHPPYHLIKMVEDSGGWDETVESCLMLVERYIDKLKKDDKYDNTAIVIMADHGDREWDTFGQNPLLLIKGINEHHPFVRSNKAVSYQDLQQAFIMLSDGSSAQDLFELDEEDNQRVFLLRDTQSDLLIEKATRSYAYSNENFYNTGNVYSKYEIVEGDYYVSVGKRYLCGENGLKLNVKQKIKIKNNGKGEYSFVSGSEYLSIVSENERIFCEFRPSNESLIQEFHIKEDGDRYRISFDDMAISCDYYSGELKVEPYNNSNVLFDIRKDEDNISDIKYDGYMVSEDINLANEDYVNELHECDKFLDYVKALSANKDRIDVYISVNDLAGRNLTEEVVRLFNTLGVKDIGNLVGYEYHSYIAALCKGRLEYECVGDDEQIQWTSGDGNLTIDSGTYRHGCCANVEINGVDYAANTRGINIVVLDSENGKVIDSIAFDTFDEANPYGYR